MKRYSVLYYYSGILGLLCIRVGSLESKNDIPIIYAVAGDIATIPCHLSTPVEDEEATMILWYRSDVPNPIYTLDLRNVPSKTARHFPAKEMDGRLKFNINIHPPVLYITQVKREDEAEYKCRVDLRRARTLILHSRLVVIVPPSDPIIMDEYGQRIHNIIGPYDEGTKVILICDVDGGYPPPSVTWWHGNTLLDDEYFMTRRGFARNKLVIPKIQRKDLMLELSCKASNTNLTKAKETRVRVDINLYPLSVTIVEPKYPLLAEECTKIACETIGSRPQAIASWWLDELKIESRLQEREFKMYSNSTSSIFQFMPRPEDNGKRLTCKSTNPALPNVTLESEMLLKVQFVPILNISLGNRLNASYIVEGSEVHLLCTVWANPKMTEVTWLFNDRLIGVNKTERTITSKFILDLGKVNRNQVGKYRCLAANSIGQGSSSNFYLQIKYVPVCKNSFTKMYRIAETENINPTCEVFAEPPDIFYRWTFVNDLGTVVLQNWTSNTMNDTISYTPKTRNGYGTLSCWGRNSIGIQLEPCLIKIMPAGAPQSPHSCIVVNQTIVNLTVECEPGYNGSLFQIFHMEMYDSVTEHLEQNLTKIDKPIFVVNGLTPGSSYLMVIYASNVKGRSESVVLMASTLFPAERKKASEEDIESLSLAFFIFISVISFISVILIFFLVKFYKSPRISRKGARIQDFTSNGQTRKKELEGNDTIGSKGPDIITFSIEVEASKFAEQLQYLPAQESSPKVPARQKYTHTVL